MARYRTGITSVLPPDQAFSALSRFDRAADWDPGVASASMVTPEPVGCGSRFLLHARFLGRSIPLVYEIVEFAAGTRLVLQAENAHLRSVDTITFAAIPRGSTTGTSGTEVTYDARLAAKGAARVAGPFLALAFRRIGDRAAAGLRKYLNAPTPTAETPR